MNKCPICSYQHEAHTSMTGAKQTPDAGDVSFCFNCNTMFVFNAELNLVIPTAKELAEIEADEKLMRNISRVRTALILKHSKN
jgi:hypothetical protein